MIDTILTAGFYFVLLIAAFWKIRVDLAKLRTEFDVEILQCKTSIEEIKVHMNSCQAENRREFKELAQRVQNQYQSLTEKNQEEHVQIIQYLGKIEAAVSFVKAKIENGR